MRYPDDGKTNPYAAPEAPLRDITAVPKRWYRFTLIELLVCLTIITVMWCLIEPARRTARSHSKRLREKGTSGSAGIGGAADGRTRR